MVLERGRHINWIETIAVPQFTPDKRNALQLPPGVKELLALSDVVAYCHKPNGHDGRWMLQMRPGVSPRGSIITDPFPNYTDFVKAIQELLS